MEHAVVNLKKGEGRFFKAGGLWIYDNEIASVTGGFLEKPDQRLFHPVNAKGQGLDYQNIGKFIYYKA